MSIPQLKNPKKLSYNDLRVQVSELARRMNILTEMTVNTIDANANPNFTFTDRRAILDLPSVGEVLMQVQELEELFADKLELCEAEKLVLDEQILVLDEQKLILDEQILILDEQILILDEQILILDEQILILNEQILSLNEQILILNEQILSLEAEILILEAALAAAYTTIDCLEDIITPEELNGVGAWSHAVETSVTVQQACSYTATSNISIKFIEMDGVNAKLQFYRTNGDSDCQANGSISWYISINYDGSSRLQIPWSGAKGATSSLVRTIAPGTYYVYARGINLVDNAGEQELQAKGSFTLSGTGEIVRTITTSYTTTEGDAAPCA